MTAVGREQPPERAAVFDPEPPLNRPRSQALCDEGGEFELVDILL